MRSSNRMPCGESRDCGISQQIASSRGPKSHVRRFRTRGVFIESDHAFGSCAAALSRNRLSRDMRAHGLTSGV